MWKPFIFHLHCASARLGVLKEKNSSAEVFLKIGHSNFWANHNLV